jgi:hypothetical protein
MRLPAVFAGIIIANHAAPFGLVVAWGAEVFLGISFSASEWDYLFESSLILLTEDLLLFSCFLLVNFFSNKALATSRV